MSVNWSQSYKSLTPAFVKLHSTSISDVLSTAGFLAKAKGELLSVSATFHAMDVVTDPEFKNKLELGSTFFITEDAVDRAWNYLLLLIKQRVWFENCPIVTKLTSQVMDWGTPYRSGDSEEGQAEAADENVEIDVSRVSFSL